MDMQAGTHAGTGETGWEPKARRGRPRDPLMEVRLLDAALEVYGQNGWLGFNLDAVARRAKVSKDALYRRWRTREALLADALRRRWDWVGGIDSGTIRGDLTELAERAFDMFAVPWRNSTCDNSCAITPTTSPSDAAASNMPRLTNIGPPGSAKALISFRLTGVKEYS